MGFFCYKCNKKVRGQPINHGCTKHGGMKLQERIYGSKLGKKKQKNKDTTTTRNKKENNNTAASNNENDECIVEDVTTRNNTKSEIRLLDVHKESLRPFGWIAYDTDSPTIRMQPRCICHMQSRRLNGGDPRDADYYHYD